MAGRFRLYTDADIHGPFVHALKRAGWDLVRAVGRPFPGLITWPKADERKMTGTGFAAAFEALAREDNPFHPYPIVYLKPKQ